MDNDLVIKETNALVASPLVDRNSSIACSRVNPLFVICRIESSGNDAEAVLVDVPDRS